MSKDAKDVRPGEERKEVFYIHIKKKRMLQCDYRHTDGELFSCVALDDMDFFDQKEAWLKKKAEC